jgi:exodeoxyribonuclease III
MRPEEFLVPWPEKILSAVLEAPRTTVEVHVVHVPPGSSNGWTKIRTFEGIFARLATESKHPRILCGDFNSPREEMDDGRTITWGQDLVGGQYACWGKWRGGTGEEWDRGERNVLVGLARFDLPDVFRAVHGFGKKEYSWYLSRKGRRIGRRFDHVFASRQLQPQECHYIHAMRDAKFSDHSALEVTFTP